MVVQARKTSSPLERIEVLEETISLLREKLSDDIVEKLSAKMATCQPCLKFRFQDVLDMHSGEYFNQPGAQPDFGTWCFEQSPLATLLGILVGLIVLIVKHWDLLLGNLISRIFDIKRQPCDQVKTFQTFF